jgi:hypothetical protein
LAHELPAGYIPPPTQRSPYIYYGPDPRRLAEMATARQPASNANVAPPAQPTQSEPDTRTRRNFTDRMRQAFRSSTSGEEDGQEQQTQLTRQTLETHATTADSVIDLTWRPPFAGMGPELPAPDQQSPANLLEQPARQTSGRRRFSFAGSTSKSAPPAQPRRLTTTKARKQALRAARWKDVDPLQGMWHQAQRQRNAIRPKRPPPKDPLNGIVEIMRELKKVRIERAMEPEAVQRRKARQARRDERRLRIAYRSRSSLRTSEDADAPAAETTGDRKGKTPVPARSRSNTASESQAERSRTRFAPDGQEPNKTYQLEHVATDYSLAGLSIASTGGPASPIAPPSSLHLPERYPAINWKQHSALQRQPMFPPEKKKPALFGEGVIRALPP